MGEMVTQLSEQVSRLVREEIRLAQLEMTQVCGRMSKRSKGGRRNDG